MVDFLKSVRYSDTDLYVFVSVLQNYYEHKLSIVLVVSIGSQNFWSQRKKYDRFVNPSVSLQIFGHFLLFPLTNMLFFMHYHLHVCLLSTRYKVTTHCNNKTMF